MNIWKDSESKPLLSRSLSGDTISDYRTENQKRRALYFILASTLFERIAFYSLINLLFITLRSDEPFNWKTYRTQSTLYSFSGTSYVSTLIFAILSDVKLGRAKTIIFGFVLYLLGYILLTITMSGHTSLCRFNSTVTQNKTTTGNELCAGPILGILFCIAIGVGAVEANIAVFGAEQNQDSKITARYFDKYALVINLGMMVAIFIIPYNQDRILINYYFPPYLLASLMLLISILLFLYGYQYYIHINSKDTLITKCIPVIINAYQTRREYKRKCLIAEKRKNSVEMQEMNGSNPNRKSLLDLIEDYQKGTLFEQKLRFLDFAKTTNDGKFSERLVNDIKRLPKVFLTFTLLVPFWLIYAQTSTTFSAQGEQMQYPKSASYIISWMSLGGPVIVIIGIILLNKFVYKYLESRDQIMTIDRKLVIGMSFASISMCLTGLIELLRQKDCIKNAEDSYLSVYAQLPQNILIGFSQLFAMVGSYEYAYLGAPISAQSLFMSLNFCSAGVSSFINTAFINVFPKPYIDLDFKCESNKEWHWSFYTYFFILAGFQLICLVIFIICQRKFKIVKLNPVHIDKQFVMITAND